MAENQRLTAIAILFAAIGGLFGGSTAVLAHGDHSGRQANMLEAATAYAPGHEFELLLDFNYNGHATKKLREDGTTLYLARVRAGGGFAPQALGEGEEHEHHSHGDGPFAPMGHMEVEFIPIALEKLPEVWDTKLGLYFLVAGLHRNLHLGQEWDANMRALGVRAMHEIPTGDLELLITFIADSMGYRKRHLTAVAQGASHEHEHEHEDEHAETEIEEDAHEAEQGKAVFEGVHLAAANLELAQQIVAKRAFKLTVAAGFGGAISQGSVGGEPTMLYDYTGYGELRGDLGKKFQLFFRGEHENAVLPSIKRVYTNIEFITGLRWMWAN